MLRRWRQIGCELSLCLAIFVVMRHDFAKICLLLFLSLLSREAWATHDMAEDRELFFSEISVKDGLSQGFVHSITKDSRGFIWVGTSGGLNRWDGYDFVRYKHNPSDSLSLCGNLVNCIAEDSDGFLWLGTGNGLCRFDPRTDRFRRYHSRDNLDGSISGDYVKSLLFDSRGRLWVGADGALNRYDAVTDSFVSYDCGGLLVGTRIYDIHEDRRGILWLATRDVGLISFDPETAWCVRYAHDPSDPCSISSNHVCCLREDSRGALWVGTWEHGINIYDRRRDIFLKEVAENDGNSPNSNQIRCFSEDSQGRMWVGTSDGLSVYSPKTGLWNYCKRHNDVPGTLSYNIINCMYADDSGAMWLGTHGGGISLYHPALGQFRLIDPKLETGKDYGYVGPMVEIDGDIWIGTEGGGLGRWAPDKKKYTFYNMRRGWASESSWNTVRALCADKNGLLWVGTYAGGILLFNPRTGMVVSHYGADEGLGNSIINEIFEDSRGNLWVGSNSDVGLYCKKSGSRTFERHVAEFEDGSWSTSGSHDFPWIRAICERKNGELWLGSISSGIMVKTAEGPARHFSVRNSQLSSNSVSCIVEDSRGMMWIGTYGGGANVFNPETGEFCVYDSDSGLSNDNVCSIVEDDSGKVWVGTIASISVYDPKSRTFSEYSFSKGSFPIETLNLKSGLRTSSGHLWFGGSNGIAEFLPESVPLSGAVPPMVIVSVTAGDRKLHPTDSDGGIESTVPYIEHLVLDYRQADFTVEFAALNYVNAKNNSYSFLLEGYDRAWSIPSHERRATYTNLPAGDYVFRVRMVRDGLLSESSGTELAIRILPPPWKRWWAYLLYTLFSLGAAVLAVWYAVVRIRGRNELRVHELEQETKERMHREQMEVFTNFSHELRTPLTLIIDPLRGILLDESLPAPLRKSLKLIQANADRILTLVNQLMDFRRQDSGQMKLRARQLDIVGFAKEMTIIFGEQSRARGITLLISSEEPSIRLCFDRFLMEKVFFNLLSNAVKNTPEGGEIRICISRFEAETLPEPLERRRPDGLAIPVVLLEVNDSGRGIPENDLERIFAPFYRVDERRNGDLYGTGIGLHLTKSIVEMHGGVIWAENLPNRGASFRILLPERGSKSGNDEASSDAVSEKVLETVNTENNMENAPSTLHDAVRKHRILIADDNQDIRSYISDTLRAEYDTAEVENGKQALAKACEWQPDLVVCDIIMPEMDGLELLRRLKSQTETSRIPVILLTARTSVEQTREGLRAGADDYVTKPFDIRLLKTRIDSLIESRVHLKEMFLKEFSVELSEGEMNHTDRYFLSRAYDYVKDHLSDENLSIEGFGRSMHLSRTQLYRKIKSMTGLSPSAFVCELRLKIAASLLSETNLNVSEVAYKVGFSSPSYFTTSFRRLYGMSPKEYASRGQTPAQE